MTTDPNQQAEPAVKPQVIDLEAVDVTAADQPSPGAREPGPVPPPPPPRPRQSGNKRWILLALIAGILAGGWLYRDILSTYLPTSEVTALKSRIDMLEAGAKTMGGQIQAVSSAADQAGQTASTLDAAVKDASAGLASMKSGIANLDGRLTMAEKNILSTRADLDKLRGAVVAGATGSGGGAADGAALAAIGQRLDTLEKDVASLKAGSGASENAGLISALRQSLSDIQAKIAAGTAYRDELDRILRMVPSAGGNDILASYADEGLPTPKGLAAELRAAIPTLPKPEAPAAAAPDGYLSGFWNAITSIVTIRNVGETDWPALAETCAKLADNGNLAQAIAAIDAAQGSVPSAIGHWRERAAARLKLDAALQELIKAADLLIAAKGGGQ